MPFIYKPKQIINCDNMNCNKSYIKAKSIINIYKPDSQGFIVNG